MDIRVDEQADLTVWSLDTSLSIYDIRGVHEAAMGGLPTTRRLELNLAGVDEIDTAGFQWLVMMRRWALGLDIEFAITEIPDPVDALIGLYRGYGALGLKAPAGSTTVPF